MKREEEIRLLDELLGLRKAKSAYLDETTSQSPIANYTDPDSFNLENKALFRGLPQLIAHESELFEDGAFLKREVAGLSLLLTKDRAGTIRAFHNVCRHRGAQLVSNTKGCKHRFTCPYHAWTWDNQGHLIAVPHEVQGFPELNKSAYGLKAVHCRVSHGWIWIQIEGHDQIDLSLEPLKDDFAWLAAENLEVYEASEEEWSCNWKLLVEGGLEAYHFRVAHARTIASIFHDNLSTYQVMGNHIRSILARKSVDDLVEMPTKEWALRDHANVLYSLFPGAAFLVQSDHIVMIQFSPLAADKTRTRIVTLKPGEEDGESSQKYWSKNHSLTVETLKEDFVLAESMQSTMTSGVNDVLNFGRFEGALGRFNAIVNQQLEQAGCA